MPNLPEDITYEARLRELERRIGELERAPRLHNASVGSGGIRVRDDGSIQFLATDGTVILELDKDALTYNRANGTRQLEVTPAGGLRIYDAAGTGLLVQLDGSGLAIDGIVQPALVNLTDSDSANPSLTASYTDIGTLTFTIPSWADEVTLYTMARLQVSNLSGSNKNVDNQLINDVGGLDHTTNDTWTIPHNETLSSFVALTTTVSSFGSTITCKQQGKLSATGTHSAESRVEGLAIVRRTS